MYVLQGGEQGDPARIRLDFLPLFTSDSLFILGRKEKLLDTENSKEKKRSREEA